MSRKVFVNLPVKNLKNSVDFFTELGFEFDPRFTDENATCMIINDDAFGMLLVEDFFKTLIKKDVSDATKQTEAIFALTAESREEVDELVNTALAAGGQPSSDPDDQGFMYGWGFEDPDGPLWQVFYMDPSAFSQ